MFFFPQLTTGASALYPMTREASFRTRLNRTQGGETTVATDSGASRREWELRAAGLTDVEREAIDSLFVAVEGSLGAFTFLDPAGNLLARSEEFQDPVWTAGAPLQLTDGHTDPFGTLRATRIANPTGSSQTILQTVPAPGNFQYGFSVWARAASAAQYFLRSVAGSSVATESRTAGAAWTRHSAVVALGSPAESLSFGFEIPAGAVVELFGAQVESEVGMSDYKKTGAEGGVIYPARFTRDELTFRAQGTDVFDGAIGIVAVRG